MRGPETVARYEPFDKAMGWRYAKALNLRGFLLLEEVNDRGRGAKGV